MAPGGGVKIKISICVESRCHFNFLMSHFWPLLIIDLPSPCMTLGDILAEPPHLPLIHRKIHKLCSNSRAVLKKKIIFEYFNYF